MNNEEELYVKRGRKYVKIGRRHYDVDIWPYGTHLVVSAEGFTSYRYNIKPLWADLLAAMKHCEEELIESMLNYMKTYQSANPKPLTTEQNAAWMKLQKLMDANVSITAPGVRGCVEKAMKFLEEKVIEENAKQRR